jgi:Nif-specific regulatory protein
MEALAVTQSPATTWIDPKAGVSSRNPLSLELCDQLLNVAYRTRARRAFLDQALPLLVQSVSGLWGILAARAPQWEIVARYGRERLPDLSGDILADALDSERGALVEPGAGETLLVVPVVLANEPGSVLVLDGTDVSNVTAELAVTLGRVLAGLLWVCERVERGDRELHRLEETLRIASNLALVDETEPLLEMIAEEATHILNCDRASIFIRDAERREVVACPALGVQGNTLRLPDDKGIVGQVIQTGDAVKVDDAYHDPRFDRSVDRDSGYRTRNLLCVPLRDPKKKLIGAFEVINKNDGTFDDFDLDSLALLGRQAAVALRNTREREQMARSRRQLTETVTEGVKIIGENAAIVALRDTIARLASTDLPVLILGESGTGKEVVAQALHFRGSRAERPFVAVNCAALTESLLESELFGHEKGAFTDAHESRPGKFELADGGTLFLDEIGDMSLSGQAKLLRVLEQKLVTRVGGSQSHPVNVRVVAATNANLAEAIQNKQFREDLYFRLGIVTLEMPPLRDRPEDILPLAEYFLETFGRQARRRLQLSAEARRRLQAHAWPGNVRELRNLIERVAFLAPADRIEADDLAFMIAPQRDVLGEFDADIGLSEATKRFQQTFIRRAIKRVKGNMSEAAKLLGLHRSNLYRKMRQLEMQEGAEEAE